MSTFYVPSSSIYLPSSSMVDDDIEIKPPIDLIPDEYTRNGNFNFYVEAFFSDNDESAIELLHSLEELNFPVKRTALDNPVFDPEWITRVQKTVNDKEYDGILLLFAKMHLELQEMKNIWSQFTAKYCPKLKNKPKIFIFQVESQKGRSVQSDSTARKLKWPAAYETPSEADILIIHDKYDDGKTDLLRQLSANVKEYGEQENIITLISLGFQCNYQPLLISTMTKSFFFQFHSYRGNHLNIRKSQKWIMKEIEKLKSQNLQ
ncbi:uncharacterized protein LOC109544917 [Dendroctonus ponderosae]|nr:uncharacterized protein LOC109544917 [Dendroctonus ponderosae]